MTDFGRRVLGLGDMLKSVYDPDLDEVIALAQTEADMTKAVYDPTLAALAALLAAHKTQHHNGGTDEIDCTGLAGRSQYVDRGDPSAWDFQVGDLTTDGLKHDMDLSAIVPAGAIAIHIKAKINDDVIDMFMAFYTKSKTYSFNILHNRVIVALLDHYVDGFIACDADRVIQYAASNTVWATIDITVRGWII